GIFGQRFSDGERPELPEDFDIEELKENLPEGFDELIGRLDIDNFSSEDFSDTLLLESDLDLMLESFPLIELTIPMLSEAELNSDSLIGMMPLVMIPQTLAGAEEGTDFSDITDEFTL
ncbi:MAG: hypothetical protein AAFO04_24240, partial [Cyanobacteria bacterium J06592_8]